MLAVEHLAPFVVVAPTSSWSPMHDVHAITLPIRVRMVCGFARMGEIVPQGGRQVEVGRPRSGGGGPDVPPALLVVLGHPASPLPGKKGQEDL